jgi:hypothetical protein
MLACESLMVHSIDLLTGIFSFPVRSQKNCQRALELHSLLKCRERNALVTLTVMALTRSSNLT